MKQSFQRGVASYKKEMLPGVQSQEQVCWKDNTKLHLFAVDANKPQNQLAAYLQQQSPTDVFVDVRLSRLSSSSVAGRTLYQALQPAAYTRVHAIQRVPRNDKPQPQNTSINKQIEYIFKVLPLAWSPNSAIKAKIIQDLNAYKVLRQLDEVPDKKRVIAYLLQQGNKFTVSQQLAQQLQAAVNARAQMTTVSIINRLMMQVNQYLMFLQQAYALARMLKFKARGNQQLVYCACKTQVNQMSRFLRDLYGNNLLYSKRAFAARAS